MRVIQRKADQGYLDRWLWVPKGYVNPDNVKSALTHVLADGYTGNEKLLYLWKESRDHLLVPRAFWDPHKLPFRVTDCRPESYPEVDFKHRIKLDHRLTDVNGTTKLLPTGGDVQSKSIAAMEAGQGGILQLACGKGKTVVALYKIATGRVPALVLLDNTNLLYQWKKEAEKLLDVPGGIGIYGDGQKEWKKGLVLATYHSMANWADTIPEEARKWFGQVFWDEGHHVAAPTFALSADMFYGSRYSLTATPQRDDGMHVIADVHIGQVLHKDLTPTMVPRFAFTWSGVSLDLKDPTVAQKVLDTNQEVHLSKVTSFFGQHKPRLDLILGIVQAAQQTGRTILVLSNSVDEIANLSSLFERGAAHPLYTDIPEPTPQDVGETISPAMLTPKDLKRVVKKKERVLASLEKIAHANNSYRRDELDKIDRDIKEARTKRGNNPSTKVLKAFEKTYAKLMQLKEEVVSTFIEACLEPTAPRIKDVGPLIRDLTEINQALKHHEVHTKIQNEMAKRQKKYIGELVEATTKSGFLTAAVPPKKRQEFLEDREVIFAVTKYGKEGMDCPRLDTVVLSSLFSSRNGLQQLLGRPTRPMPGKKKPVLVGIVDDVGTCIGMSRSLIQHLRDWPTEEGGPYSPILIGYPQTWTKNNQVQTIPTLFGQ